MLPRSRLVLAAIILGLAGAQIATGQGTRADYERASAAGRLPNPSPAVKATWVPSRAAFWYPRGSADAREWIFVDAETGTRRTLFSTPSFADAARARSTAPASTRVVAIHVRADGGVLLRFEKDPAVYLWSEPASSLTRAAPEDAALLAGDANLSMRPRRTQRNGDSTSITFINDREDELALFWVAGDNSRHPYGTLKPRESRDQHTYAGHAWVIVAPDGKDLGFTVGQDYPATITITNNAAAAEPRPDEPRREPRPQPGASPDGRFRAYVRDANLVLSADGSEKPLTNDATPENAFSGRIEWAPDSRRFVAVRTRAGGDRRVTYIQSSPSEQLQPIIKSYPYLKPGDAIPQERPCLFDAAAGKEIPIDSALFDNPWDIRDIRWAPDSSRFTFIYNQRGHTVMRLLSVDAATGAVTPIINEECPTFFDYAAKFFLHFLDRTNEVIWMSERDGWNHLYLVDSRTGDLKTQITSGPWVVRGVDSVDEDARQIWFRACGIIPGQDPYHVHAARINFDGSGLVVLTAGDGTHRVEYSPDNRYLIDTYSRVDLPPVTELRRAADGSLVTPLEGDASISSPAFPQRFVAKGRDGVTDIWGVIIRPSNFDPSKEYPVIEQIYAGPHDQHVPKAYRTDWGYPAQMAELGFIVVQIDGMGTNWRSKAFHDVAWKNLKDAGFPDRIAWLKAAAAKHPELDLDNHGRGVGIYGGSAGGQNAMAALLWHGDFYKAAAADCGCHDNRMDKIWWNELWMSWPIGPHYEACSNVVNAHLLPSDCHLMLFVGEMDENVDPASTMQVVNALVKADKDFDLVVVPNAGHGSAESGYGRRRRMDFFVRHLMNVEPRRADAGS